MFLFSESYDNSSSFLTYDAAQATFSPFESFWQTSLTRRLWFFLDRWHGSFNTADDARLIPRNIERECLRADIEPKVWADFFRELRFPVGGERVLDGVAAAIEYKPI